MDKFVKDPDAVLDYKMDWSDWLGEDTISASSWAVDNANITIDSDTHTTTDTTVWLSGGEAKKSYRVTNSIETAAGRKNDRSFTIICKEL